MRSKKQRVAMVVEAQKRAAIGTSNLDADTIASKKDDTITNKLLEEWQFWTWDQRELIAKELLERRAKDENR